MIGYLEQLLQKIRPYILKYRNGFFELPFIGNSPQLMWESFKTMPFCNFDAVKNRITANNLFLNADVYYHDFEDGLVFIYSSVYAKRNIVYKQLFQEKIPIKHYCLSYLKSELYQETGKTIIQDVQFEGSLWMLFKPGAEIKNYHFKGAHTSIINFYFTQKWLDSYLKKNPMQNEQLIQFLESKNELIISKHSAEEDIMNLLSMGKNIMISYSGQDRNEPFISYTTEFVKCFKRDCLSGIESKNYFTLTNIDRIKIKQAEQILQHNLQSKFPGIIYVAQEVSLSETKLKALFKIVHGTTLLNYFQRIKMSAAKEMLETKQQKISQVASHFGYENASKFSAAFKQQFDYLPSQMGTDVAQKQQLK